MTEELEPEHHLAVLDLYARYNWAADDGDGAAWEECFFPDAVFSIDGNPWRNGRDELAAKRRQPVPGSPRQHWNSSILLRREGGFVRGRAQCVALDVIDDRPVVRAIEAYSDLIGFHDGRWRFKQRAIRILYSDIDAELFPTAQRA
jgi:hypothetical protein